MSSNENTTHANTTYQEQHVADVPIVTSTPAFVESQIYLHQYKPEGSLEIGNYEGHNLIKQTDVVPLGAYDERHLMQQSDTSLLGAYDGHNLMQPTETALLDHTYFDQGQRNRTVTMDSILNTVTSEASIGLADYSKVQSIAWY